MLPATLPSPAASLESAMSKAKTYVLHSRAENTRRAYAADWRHFTAWCDCHQVEFLPALPATVAVYIAELADSHKPATITRRLAAISKAHSAAGYASPGSLKHAAVAEVLAGIRRVCGTAQTAKNPILTADLKRLLVGTGDNLKGIRDRALLLLGFAGGFRRSELAALQVSDVAFTEDGAVVTLRRTKTDQEGQGRKVGIPYGSHPTLCPVRSLRRWIEAAALADGPLFRSVDKHGKVGASMTPQTVRLVIVGLADTAGLDASRFSAHSLRAGLATQATINGASERAIMKQTGHKSVAMVRRYVRDANLFRENAAAHLGL
jgi:site-specific recombinase XerD